jgi:WXG100 family type VII secretion target
LGDRAHVGQAQITAAAKKADDVGEGIAGNLNVLMMQIEAAEAGFKGGGGTAFQTKSAEVHNDLKIILRNLNKLSQAADSSVTDYGSTDDDIANEINQVGGSYSGGSVADGLRG